MQSGSVCHRLTRNGTVLGRALVLVHASALALLGDAALPSGFPAGWNGEATKPPMAWRSWNAFYAAIDDPLMRQSIDALSRKAAHTPVGAVLLGL